MQLATRLILVGCSALAAFACVATSVESTSHDPESAEAQVAPLPDVGRTFAKDFDPLAPVAEGRPSVAGHNHQATGSAQADKEEPPAAASRWTCPMHPEIVRDKPGNCPICGMKLVPLKEPAKKPPQ